MKSVVYLNKNKVYFDGRAFDWDKNTLGDIFLSIKKDQKLSDIRIVLGSDVSYVVDFKVEDASKVKRDEILKMARSWLPFVVTDECFDWKMITLGEADVWIQVVALEPELLNIIRQATEKSNLKVEWVIPVGIVLGSVSIGREVPILIKWRGKEELSVLAQRGLVDLVTTENNDSINNYARQKWHLEVNPEEILLTDSNFKFEEVVMSARVRGSDADILAISIGNNDKGVGEFVPPGIVDLVERGESAAREIMIIKKPNEGSLIRPVYIVILLLSLITMLGVLFWQYQFPTKIVPSIPVSPNSVTVPATTDVPVATAAAGPIDFTLYRVQLQDASGLTGALVNEKNILLQEGFVNIDMATASAQQPQTLVAYKAGTPAEVVALVINSLRSYEISNVLYLANNIPYDISVVLGSTIKK
ncbi:MAG TPA: hypothetical protein VF837_02385 [Patescibacteria group bacterium]